MKFPWTELHTYTYTYSTRSYVQNAILSRCTNAECNSINFAFKTHRVRIDYLSKSRRRFVNMYIMLKFRIRKMARVRIQSKLFATNVYTKYVNVCGACRLFLNSPHIWIRLVWYNMILYRIVVHVANIMFYATRTWIWLRL